jgi:four helix bundle protein
VGHGRHSFKEDRNFCWIARGALSETKTAVDKSMRRNLISAAEYDALMLIINECYPKLNNYISFIDRMIAAQSKSK